MNTYKAEPLTVSTTEPLRSSRLESEVLVPVAQAAITALITFVVLGVLAWRAGWPVDVPIFGTLAVAVVMWAWRLLRSDALMWRLERITGRDLDGDGKTGNPGPITLFDPAVARRKAANAPVDDDHSDQERMLQFVAACFAQGTSEARQGIKPNTAAQENYRECRDALFSLGLAQWRNSQAHNAGWDIVIDKETALSIVEAHT